MGYLNLENLLNNKEGKGFILERNTGFNSAIENALVDRIKNTVFNIFEYEGLPEGTPDHIIESILYSNGLGVAWSVAGKVYFSGNFTPSGERDLYNRPLRVKPIYLNGKNSVYKDVEDVVFLRNNILSTSTADVVSPFIDKLKLNQEAIMTLLDTSMTKWAMNVDSIDRNDVDNIRTSLRNLFNSSSRIAVLPSSTNIKVDELKFYEEFKSTEYWNDFNNTFNLLWTFLGIKGNANEDKKERLLVDEINVYEERITLLLIGMITQRQKFIKEINDKFGLDIKMYINIERGKEDESNNAGFVGY